MNRFYMLSWLAIAILTTPSSAQFGGFGHGDGHDGFDPGARPDAFDHGELNFESGEARMKRRIHGILASVAFVILFPLGAIAMATMRGRWAFWVHSIVQMAGWLLFIIAAGLGFWMLREVRVPGHDGDEYLINNPHTRYHPIIGIVLFILIVFQPVLGWLHHRQFKVQQRRTLVSYIHLINGRLLIFLGIINGGLGLKVSRAPHKAKVAYGVVAGLLGIAWLVVTVLSEIRKFKGKDIWGNYRTGSTGKSVRMERINKAVRAGSEAGDVDGVEARFV